MLKLNRKGFTLVEVLLVIVIIAILAGIVIVAINPARQIAQANNTQRSSDVQAVMNAVHEYTIDNRGQLPTVITTTATVMGNGAGQVDVCALLVPTYIAEMPYDPTDASSKYTSCSDYNSGYTVASDAAGRITITAPGAELAETISITR